MLGAMGRAATVQGVQSSAWASGLAEWILGHVRLSPSAHVAGAARRARRLRGVADAGSDPVEQEGLIGALPGSGRVVHEASTLCSPLGDTHHERVGPACPPGPEAARSRPSRPWRSDSP
jgi:hypothetical protein